MFWSAQRLVSRPNRTSRSARNNAAASRRTQLQIDCLEDRFAPATLVLLGQPAEAVVSSVSVVNFTASTPTVLTSVNAPVSSASSISTHATFDEIPFGFFHPFCQTGVIGEEMCSTEPPLAPPPAIQPPVLDDLPVPSALPSAPPPAPQVEMLPVPARDPAAPAPLDPKSTLLELTRLNDVPSAVIDDRVWEELFKPSDPMVDSFALTADDAPGSPTLGAALAAIGLLSLPSMHNRRERAVALDI